MASSVRDDRRAETAALRPGSEPSQAARSGILAAIRFFGPGLDVHRVTELRRRASLARAEAAR